MVRVYSEMIERKEFPLPRDSIACKKSGNAEASMDPNLSDVALHHLIRQPGNPASEIINKMDELFRMSPDEVSESDIQEYLNIVSHAEIDQLKRAQIILCTCSASSSPKMKLGSNIQQVIMSSVAVAVWFSEGNLHLARHVLFMNVFKDTRKYRCLCRLICKLYG